MHRDRQAFMAEGAVRHVYLPLLRVDAGLLAERGLGESLPIVCAVQPGLPPQHQVMHMGKSQQHRGAVQEPYAAARRLFQQLGAGGQGHAFMLRAPHRRTAPARARGPLGTGAVQPHHVLNKGK